jgi:thiol:disulfide interchange protein
MLRFKLNKSILFFFSLFFMGQLGLHAQILDPVSWRASVEQEGDEATLIIKANIGEGWHLYSQHLPSDEGPIASEFTFTESSDFTTDGPVKEGKFITHYDPNFEMDLNYFEGRAVFKQKIKVTSSADFIIKGSVYYMVCDEEKCLPPKDVEIEFKVAGVSGAGDGNGQSAPQDDDEETAGEEPPSIEIGQIGDGSNPTSGILNPVVWKFSSEEHAQGQYKLMLTATIDAHWHMYSQTLESDEGPVATEVGFNLPDGLTLFGGVEEEGTAIDEYDESFEMNLTYYSDEVTFTQIVNVPEGQQLPEITGFVYYMTCDDSKCLPPKNVDFFIDLVDGTGGEVDDSNPAAVSADTVAASGVAADCEPVGDDCCAKVFDGSADVEVSYIALMVEAFLWGLAALLTPCVFPMIPMTVSFFLKEGEKPSGKGMRQAIFFGSSIIVIYTAVGTLVTILFGADFANWLATHWVPNTLFFLIFMFFAASFFGMFEITLPSWIVNKSDKQADKGGLLGPFFMALTLVVVSFSCTGPIVGLLLIKATTAAGTMSAVLGMFAFSLAFALPFTAFAVFPKLLNKLPQSGGWLNSVKVILGFIEVALGLKFLSVADQTYHWGILDREVYLALWIVVFSLMGAYLLGKIKFSHDSDMPFIKVPRLFMGIATLSFVVYLVPGMWGAPLKALSGYLPPMSSHDFDLIGAARGDHGAGGGNCGDAKYSDFLHLPHGLKGYYDFDEAMACSNEQNKPLFIDFTGHGCVNCREMEANVWSDPRVLKMLQEDFIIVAIYVDDKTVLPEDEWIVSKFDGRTKKTIGAINLDFQMCSFNANAQPLYCLLDNDENLLAPKRGYDKDIDAFVEFLEESKKLFEQRELAN